MTKIIDFVKYCRDFIPNYWRIATAKHTIYEYVIEDIELQQTNNSMKSVIYYRAIGSRTVEYGSASELNESNIFAKFMPQQAQALVTLATIETMMELDKTTLLSSYRGYVEKCAKLFRSQRGK